MRKSIYLAAPLFSMAERTFNGELALRLEENADVFLPQRDGRLIIDLLDEGFDVEQAKRLIFERDVDALQRSDIVLGVLDGRVIDEGVAVELALGYAFKKICWGLKTDFRSLCWFGDNPMVEVLIGRRFETVDAVVVAVQSARWAEA
ncbi:nucleoside 2-deoxyribosyltransferase [uncultured Enterovirga sp.]|uniref:nucleoside 2-deoxyribosyltransferase n=1 Tax=uncultured Enterovirga sp. TaxID=2026352 RepID=UPI0035CC5623